MATDILFTDLLVEFLIARDELLFEESKTPPSSRQISAARERLSETKTQLNSFFDKRSEE